MIINIESCEKYISNIPSVQYKVPENNMNLLNFKEPIDYSKFNKKQDIESIEDEDVERIMVDVSKEQSDKIVSITDLLLGTNKEDE